MKLEYKQVIVIVAYIIIMSILFVYFCKANKNPSKYFYNLTQELRSDRNFNGGKNMTNVTTVTPKWVEEHAGDKDVRILDLRPDVYDYFPGHVPNAVHLADVSVRFPAAGYPSMFGETSIIESILANAGVKKQDKVVLYSDGNNVLGATMLAYLLEKVGHANIYIMDGGWTDYKAASMVSQSYPLYEYSKYQASVNTKIYVNLDEVKSSIGKNEVKLIDARPADVYNGEKNVWQRNGHIPGAVNIPWKLLVEKNNLHKFKSVEEIKKIYDLYGIKESDNIIVYCGTNREASLEYVVLKHILKFPNVRLYEGSWSEYSSYPELPIETASKQ